MAYSFLFLSMCLAPPFPQVLKIKSQLCQDWSEVGWKEKEECVCVLGRPGARTGLIVSPKKAGGILMECCFYGLFLSFYLFLFKLEYS